MRRARPLAVGLAAGLAVGLAVGVAGGLAGCGGGAPIPNDDLALRVTAGATDVASGVAFPLTVVRVWRKDLVPAAWDERALAPLAVRRTASSRREDDRHVEETRTYRAYAFAREDVVVTPAPMIARALDGGPERRAEAPPFSLRVRPLLDAAAPGVPELPAWPSPPAFPWLAVAGGGLLVAAAAVAARLRRARVAPAPAPAPGAPAAPPGPSAADVATSILVAIAARDEGTADDRRGDAVAITEVVRRYVADRFGVPTARRTSAEVLALPLGALDGEARSALRTVFARGDAVKFADHVPTPADRSAHLAAARDFVAATRGPGAP